MQHMTADAREEIRKFRQTEEKNAPFDDKGKLREVFSSEKWSGGGKSGRAVKRHG
jgi:hypothetical protein